MDKSLLNRATSTDDAPTPGYLYGEIARMTQHSYETCLKTMEFLMARVKKKHHNTKFKALQVIKHVCREGRQDFRREMQKHVPIIKECLQFRGPPDPLKGDEYYRRVREAAKECLDAIFDNTNAQPAMGSAGISARIQGVGNVTAEQQPQSSSWTGKWWGGNSAAGQPSAAPSNYNAPSYGQNAPVPGYSGPPAGPGGYNGPEGMSQYGGPTGGYNAPGGEKAGGYGGQSQGYPPAAPAPYGQESYGGPGGYNQGAAGAGYGGPPPTQMSGIGNPMYQNTRGESKGFFQGLKEKAASTFTRDTPKTNFAGPPPGAHNPPEGWSYATNRGPTSGNYAPQGGAYNPEEAYSSGYNAGGGYSRPDPQAHLQEKAYDGNRKKGSVGGSWGAMARPSSAKQQRPDAYSDSGDSANSEDAKRPAPQRRPSNSNSYARATGRTTGASSDGSYERNVISSLCAPAGMRAVPPKDKLDTFLKNAMTLDAELTGPVFEDLLEDSTWQVNSKALVTIDALIKTPGCEHFFDYFEENPGAIENCANSTKAAVRDRAIKVLHVLGLDSGESTSQATSYKRNQRVGSTDLLGGFEDDVPAVAATSSLLDGLPPQQKTSVVQAGDMFGGLSLGGSTSTDPPAAAAPVAATIPAAHFDPLLEPVPSQQQQYQQNTMNVMNMMGSPNAGGMQAMNAPPGVGMMDTRAPVVSGGLPQHLMGSAMTPKDIVKTIHEPTNTGFSFMAGSSKKKDDSFSFVKDAMKNS